MRLFGDGKHGHAERIQTFRCQACRTTFTARRDTPLYRLKTPSHQVAMVLSALAEGLDASAAERVFGSCQATITRWLTRAGKHAQTLHERSFCHLHLPHVQLDERRTRLRCAKEVRLDLAGHRPLHQDPTRAATGSSHPTHGASAHPLAATATGRLSACRSSPVMGSICTFLPSPPTLASGERCVVEDATCADGWWNLGWSTAR